MRDCVTNPRGGAARTSFPLGWLRPACSAAHPSRHLGSAWAAGGRGGVGRGAARVRGGWRRVRPRRGRPEHREFRVPEAVGDPQPQGEGRERNLGSLFPMVKQWALRNLMMESMMLKLGRPET